RNKFSEELNDSVISNNGDSEMVLATVVESVLRFTDENPDAWIYATGSTPSRTRLYRMGISKYLMEIETEFEVYGQRNDRWEEFERNVDYEAFLAKRIKM